MERASARARVHTRTHSLALSLRAVDNASVLHDCCRVCEREAVSVPLPPGQAELPRQRARPSSLFVVHYTLGPSSQDCGTMLLRSGSGSQSSYCKEVGIVTQTTSLAR